MEHVIYFSYAIQNYILFLYLRSGRPWRGEEFDSKNELQCDRKLQSQIYRKVAKKNTKPTPYIRKKGQRPAA